MCGWCFLENRFDGFLKQVRTGQIGFSCRCSRQSQCSTGSPEWVSDGMGSCPVITSADPSILYVRELQVREMCELGELGELCGCIM